MSMEQMALKAVGLNKSFGTKEVLKNLDLTIEPGRIYGLIGRNGAGKTTLLACSPLSWRRTGDKSPVGASRCGKIRRR